MHFSSSLISQSLQLISFCSQFLTSASSKITIPISRRDTQGFDGGYLLFSHHAYLLHEFSYSLIAFTMYFLMKLHILIIFQLCSNYCLILCDILER